MVGGLGVLGGYLGCGGGRGVCEDVGDGVGVDVGEKGVGSKVGK